MELIFIMCTCLLVPVYSGSTNTGGNNNAGDVGNTAGAGDFERVRLTYNLNSKFHFLVNEKAEVGWFIETNTSLFLLADGRNGAAIVINYDTGRGVYILNGTSKLTWISNQESFEQYALNQPSLLPLFNEQGVTFDVASPPAAVSAETSQILQPFYNLLTISPNNSIAFVYTLMQQVSVGLLTTLKGLYKVFQGPVTPSGDELSLAQNLIGLISIFQNIGGVETLAQKNIKLDLGQVISARSGFEALSYLLTSLNAANFNISTIFAQLFNTDYQFFVLVNQLSGDTLLGEEGLINIVSRLIGYAEGNVTKGEAQFVLDGFQDIKKQNLAAIKQNWQSSLTNFLGLFNNLQLANRFPKLSQTLQSLIAGNLQINNVKISTIVNGLLNGQRSASTNL